MTQDITVENYIKNLRNYFRTILIYEAISALIIGILYYFFGDSIRLDTQPALMGKSIFFAVFLIAFPSLLSHFHARVNKMQTGLSAEMKMDRYDRDYRFLNNALLVLFVLCLFAFILTGDPFVLIFLLADLFFIFYERPTYFKIKEIIATPEEE